MLYNFKKLNLMKTITFCNLFCENQMGTKKSDTCPKLVQMYQFGNPLIWVTMHLF
jgi:hypothetical protein